MRYLLIALGITLLWANEFRTKIVVMDTYRTVQTGAECLGEQKVFVKKDFELSYHANTITEIIAKDLDKNRFCIENYTVLPERQGIQQVLEALKTITRDPKVKYLNLSMSGTFYSKEERDLLFKLANSGVKIFIAAGNEGNNLDEVCRAYPACYFLKPHKNVRVVGFRGKKSNYGRVVTDVRVGKWSSFTTPIVLREVLEGDSK